MFSSRLETSVFLPLGGRLRPRMTLGASMTVGVIASMLRNRAKVHSVRALCE